MQSLVFFQYRMSLHKIKTSDQPTHDSPLESPPESRPNKFSVLMFPTRFGFAFWVVVDPK
jgi:hypothetical protein